jgi:endonuclease YncB( thermonuclease family)
LSSLKKQTKNKHGFRIRAQQPGGGHFYFIALSFHGMIIAYGYRCIAGWKGKTMNVDIRRFLCGLPVFLLLCMFPVSAFSADAGADADPDNLSLFNSLSAAQVFEATRASVKETFSGIPESFESGDVLVVLRKQEKVTVRLYGVDCPEEGQPFFEEAKTGGHSFLGGEAAEISILSVDNKDLPVVLILNKEKQSLSHYLAAKGLGWWDEKNAPKDALLRKLSAGAVLKGQGIFSQATPLAPWDYRKSKEIEDFTYTLETVAEPVPDKKTARSDSESSEKSLSKKGTMVESAPRTAPVQLKAPAEKIDAGALMMRHQPRISRDESGRPQGLTATDISAIPYAAQLGFQNGDIISRVNGIAIESEAQIMGLIPQFQNVKQFQVEVIRNGRSITIPISIP